MVLLVQRHKDFAVEGSNIRSKTEGEIDGILRQTDIVKHQIQLVGRNDLANLLLHFAEENRRLLDARAGHETNVKAELAGIDRGKEILADEGQQQERSRHYACAGDEGDPAMLEETVQQGGVIALHAKIAGVEAVIKSLEP